MPNGRKNRRMYVHEVSKNRKRALFPYALSVKENCPVSFAHNKKKRRKRSLEVPLRRGGYARPRASRQRGVPVAPPDARRGEPVVHVFVRERLHAAVRVPNGGRPLRVRLRPSITTVWLEVDRATPPRESSPRKLRCAPLSRVPPNDGSPNGSRASASNASKKGTPKPAPSAALASGSASRKSDARGAAPKRPRGGGEEGVIRERVPASERLAEHLERVVMGREPAPEPELGAERRRAAGSSRAPRAAASDGARSSFRAFAVVRRALALVAQHLVRRGHLLEHHLRRRRVARVLIGVPPHGELAVRPANGFRVRGGIDAERRVKVRSSSLLRWKVCERSPGVWR